MEVMQCRAMVKVKAKAELVSGGIFAGLSLSKLKVRNFFFVFTSPCFQRTHNLAN